MSDEKTAKVHDYFLDAKKYQTEKKQLTGLEIKQSGAVPAEYQLYEEEQGETPDKAIADAESVELTGKVKHFYAVPPATFGW